jgi:prepilin-type N-terminal cleavage/methylation domain-containing protein
MRVVSPDAALIKCVQQRGFTLIEVAIALSVMALLLGGIAVTLQAQFEKRLADGTQRVLEEAREALLGYVIANGYFPCPADDLSNGQEPAASDHDAGTCPTWFGFLPAAALGLRSVDAQGYAVDALGQPQNRIRYAVSNQTVAGVTNPFTSANGIRTLGVSLLDSNDLFYVCSSSSGVNAGVNCGASVTLTSSAVVVVWSVGPNAATGGGSADEAENPNPNGGTADNVFVSKTRSTASGAEFDDTVTWIPTTILLNRIIAAGQLL